MLGGLAGAIHRSHDRIAGLVAENPEIEGTSTTVTAVIFDGTHIGVGHVGDSRGYLLRDGTLSQLTTDHTFVQSLIDEGRITEDEARVHPHRNLILRAVDGVHEPEPDVFTLEVAAGDRILLCSDGCSGVLSDDEPRPHPRRGHPRPRRRLADQRLARRRQLRQRHRRGRRRRRRRRRSTTPRPRAAAVTGPMVVGAAAEAPRRRGTRRRRAARAADTGELEPIEGGDGDDVDPEEMRYAPRPPRRFTWARRIAVLARDRCCSPRSSAFAGYEVEPEPVLRRQQRRRRRDLPRHRGRRARHQHPPRRGDQRPQAGRPPGLQRAPGRDGISASSLSDARGIVSRLQRDSRARRPRRRRPPPRRAASRARAPRPAPNKKKRRRASRPPRRPTATASPSERRQPLPRDAMSSRATPTHPRA